MTEAQRKVIQELRDAGYAVVIWEPGELGKADPDKVEDRSVELGWDIIAALKD